ncbi:mercuric transporter MerT family protein [Oceanibacterium hippocampi]|uniref:Mercuric transport protein MerT n=1 Tax=Oceanibacterium hippocampi TaxID=745714 RepID=A0A1Y5TSU4_9PROT|nr:mercuric transporter MerT family protein [Oceanibacterium hippocampi]SLN71306.1 MerT mercuric transport protein [Oceanibacterium hippocampi]
MAKSVVDIEGSGSGSIESGQRKGWLAAGGVIGAILASSCCIVPLVLVTLGISGAWIGNLTALEPYKPVFAVVTLVFIGLGFWHVYLKAKPACVDGSYCARPQSGLITRSALWIATVLVILSLTIDWWAPLFY